MIYIAILAITSSVWGCGDFEDLSRIEPQLDDLETSREMGELRERTSKLCNCPPSIRVFYSTPSDPNCSWVCGRIVALKDAVTDVEETKQSKISRLRKTHDRTSVNRNQYGKIQSVPTSDREERECYTVCPDWTVLGPHPCDEIPECLDKDEKNIDFYAGQSSVSETRFIIDERGAQDTDTTRR